MTATLRKLTLLFAIASIAAPLSAAVQGVIMTTDGKAIENASVKACAPESSEASRERLQSAKPDPVVLASAATDRTGKFSIDTRSEPVVRLLLSAPGYAPRGILASATDDIGAIPLVAAEMKKGTVTAEGKPVAGALVVWYATDRAEIEVRTDEKGQYQVPDPGKWASAVFVFHPDYAIARAAGLRAKLPLDHQLEKGIDLSGTVSGADGKTPVAGAALLVDEWRTAQSGEDGSFTFHHVASTWEVIRATKGDLAGAVVRSGSTRSIRLRPAAAVAGTVTDAKTGAGVAGALVRISEGQSRSAGRTEVTDSKGHFAFDGLLPGDFSLSSNVPNYEDAAERLAIAAGDKLQKKLVLVRTATVVGEVVDEGKKAIAAAALRTSAGDQVGFPRFQRPGQFSYSGPDGRFVIREVPPNEDLGIEAQKKGQPSARTASQKFSPGERKTGVIITLPLGIAVTGRVTDPGGHPIAGVAVGSAPASDRGGMMRRMIIAADRDEDDRPRTDAEGNFEIRLKEGRYDLQFSASGYASKTSPAITVAPNLKPLNIVLEPGVEISGRVVRADGAGVGEVRINVIGESNGNSLSAPDGSFTISDLAPGQMMLMAMKPEDFISERRAVTAPASNLRIEIPAGGIISGRVIDKASKEPVTSFRAGPSNTRRGAGMVMAGPRMLQTFRADDGAFVLNNVPAGQTQLVVEAPGYVTATVGGLTVDPDKPVQDLEVSMEAGVKLSGKVTGADGTPLSGAAAMEENGDPMPGGRGRNAASTDSDGSYTIDGLESGEHTFTFSKSGYVPERKTVKLSAKETSLDVRLSHGTEVHGVVVDQSGTPVAEAQVVARGAVEGAGFNQARSDSNGAFQFEGLTPGRYSFRADKSGYVSGSTDDVDIQSTPSVRIALKGGGVVFGTVTGFTGDEASRVTVRATGGREGGTSRLDANGSYRIEGVPAGTVTVTASINGMSSGRTTVPKTIELGEGGSSQVDLQFNNDTVVEGRVTQAGRPLAGRMVAFVPRTVTTQGSGGGQTDENGHYSVTGLQPGEYNVRVVDISSMQSYNTTHSVQGSGTFDIEITSASLSGRVLDSDSGAPISEADISVEADGDAGAIRFGTPRALTAPDGTFRMDSVSPGNYHVRAQKAGYGQQIQDVMVSESGASPVELRLAKQDGASLRVLDGRDGRSLDATFFAMDASGRQAYQGWGNRQSDGSVSLPLSSGAYRLIVIAPTYATRVVRINSPSAGITVAMTPGGALDIVSPAAANQSARIVDASGQPYPRGMSLNGELLIRPGVNHFDNVAPGNYTIVVSGVDGQAGTSRQVTVGEGQTSRVQL